MMEKLNVIQEYLYKIGGPILIVVGTISSFISLYVFTKKSFRKSPCSIYLISINIINLLYIYVTILISTLAMGYRIQLALYHLSICRWIYYLSFVFDVLSPSYLILLSIDRLCISSSSVRIRQTSTHRFACQSIFIVTLFWLLFHLHAFLFIRVISLDDNQQLCYFQKGTYTMLIGSYTLIVKSILIPFLLILFGFLTLTNIRRLKSTKNNANQSKDRQFQLILFIELMIHISFTISLALIIIYQQMSYGLNEKTNIEAKKNMLIRFVARFLTHIPFCISVCEYLLVSKAFRKELICFRRRN